jgi:hypothetical protein
MAAAEEHGEPFAASSPGCGARVAAGSTISGSRCGAAPTWAGLIYYSGPGEAWLAFTCDRHRGRLIAPRRLLERDRAEIAARRERIRRTVEDKAPWVKPKPAATGAAARRLVEAARAWAERHPD